MEIEISIERASSHFGYQADAVKEIPHGLWPAETVLDRIPKIPELLKLEKAEKKKFRLVLDYDPEFPRALIQFQTAGDKGYAVWQGQLGGINPEVRKSDSESQ